MRKRRPRPQETRRGICALAKTVEKGHDSDRFAGHVGVVGRLEEVDETRHRIVSRRVDARSRCRELRRSGRRRLSRCPLRRVAAGPDARYREPDRRHRRLRLQARPHGQADRAGRRLHRRARLRCRHRQSERYEAFADQFRGQLSQLQRKPHRAYGARQQCGGGGRDRAADRGQAGPRAAERRPSPQCDRPAQRLPDAGRRQGAGQCLQPDAADIRRRGALRHQDEPVRHARGQARGL